MKYSGKSDVAVSSYETWEHFYNGMEAYDNEHGVRCHNGECDILLHETETGRRRICNPQTGEVYDVCSDCFFKEVASFMPESGGILPAPS
ncbi:MAG: hypothetical protein AAGA25_10590 [Planctomycetota bacterium]